MREALGRVASHPVSKRLMSNYSKYGKVAAEIYTQFDDGTGVPRYFDVFSTRMWCERKKPVIPFPIDVNLVEHLRCSDAIDHKHLKTKNFDEGVAPVIFLDGATAGGGLLIDGAHRYVAFADEVRARGLEGQARAVPAYVLKPSEWQRFVVPPSVAKAFLFGEQSLDV